jgi:hypothetical protein
MNEGNQVRHGSLISNIGAHAQIEHQINSAEFVMKMDGMIFWSHHIPVFM